jgi:hypothetical protein
MDKFADSLHADNRELFMSMLNDCYRYAAAINAKVQPFPGEAECMYSQKPCFSKSE